MIEISSKENKYTYNVYHLAKAFFPEEEIVQKVDEKQEPLVKLNVDGGSSFCIRKEEINGTDIQERKRSVTRNFYLRLSEMTGRNLHGGCLQACVRPNWQCRQWRKGFQKKR